jgi:hypothetical protein
MRHPRAAPGAVGALPGAMIQATLGTPLVAPTGHPETPGAAGAAARRAAVRVAPVARPAEEEGPLTPTADTDAEDLHNWLG